MNMTDANTLQKGFLDSYTGRMSGVLRWPQLDALWRKLDADDGWYLYEIGSPLPDTTLNEAQLAKAIAEMDAFLRREHDESYCGVVYADSLQNPQLIKVYHPKKMGASCGCSGSTILPRWTLSRQAPVDLVEWALEKDEKPAWWKHLLKRG